MGAIKAKGLIIRIDKISRGYSGLSEIELILFRNCKFQKIYQCLNYSIILCFSEIPKRFLMDGVYLNQSGINLIQNLMAQVPKVRRPRKKKILEQEMSMKAQLEGQFKAPSIARMLSTQSSVDGDEGIIYIF